MVLESCHHRGSTVPAAPPCTGPGSTERRTFLARSATPGIAIQLAFRAPRTISIPVYIAITTYKAPRNQHPLQWTRQHFQRQSRQDDSSLLRAGTRGMPGCRWMRHDYDVLLCRVQQAGQFYHSCFFVLRIFVGLLDLTRSPCLVYSPGSVATDL
ncbi:uncharacterized protein LOC142559488 [Dermacentor variabilis]|uniref:uncharacterized protein LOC142559488 n=1 Tax=Dermacentor variabilis TaxID=34621 RepID=UPI003F5C2639